MAQLTYAQQAQKLERIIKQLEENKPLEIAFRDIAGAIGERIFEKGLNVNGGPIGQYSKKPIYISDDQAPRSTNHRGKTGKTIKGGYYAGGYYEFRGQQGRENSFVNLRLTNELQNDLLNANVARTSGSPAQITDSTPFKISNTAYELRLKKQVNVNKRLGIDAKYGKVFGVSKAERERFLKTLDFETKKVMRNA